MRMAIELAKKAGASGETPVGCVIVDADGVVIGRGRNRREKSRNAAAHAEIEAISDACKAIGDWRLSGCSLYTTLEPCPMCAGAIIMSRVDSVFFGADDKQTGSCGSIINLFMEPFGHKTRVTGGVLPEECASLLSGFFAEIRSCSL